MDENPKIEPEWFMIGAIGINVATIEVYGFHESGDETNGYIRFLGEPDSGRHVQLTGDDARTMHKLLMARNKKIGQPLIVGTNVNH